MKRFMVFSSILLSILAAKADASQSKYFTPSIMYFNSDGVHTGSGSVAAGKDSYGNTFRSYIRISYSSIRAAIPPHTKIGNVYFEMYPDQDNFQTNVEFRLIASQTSPSAYYSAIGSGSADTTIDVIHDIYPTNSNPPNFWFSFSQLTAAAQSIVNGTSSQDVIIGIKNGNESSPSEYFSCGNSNPPISFWVTYNLVSVTLNAPGYVDPGSGAYYTVSNVVGSQNTTPDQSFSGSYPQGGDLTIQAHGPSVSGTSWAPGWTNLNAGNPVTIDPTSNFNTGASFKELQHSTDASAYSDNSQRKMIRVTNGTNQYLFETYTDNGHVWLEYSSNNGTSWTLANNGEPLDYDFVTHSGSASKCPSLDYNPSTYDVIVVFQVQNGTHYNIEYDLFSPSGTSYINVFDQQPATIYSEPSDGYSVNANLAFAVYHGYWVCAFEQKTATGNQTAGINYLFGPINSSDGNLETYGPFSMWGTNSGSTLPSIYGAKTQSAWAACVAWQQGSGSSSTIRFAAINFNGTQTDTTSETGPKTISNSAWPANYQPSLVQKPDNNAWVCWIANNFGRPPQNITLFSKDPNSSSYNTIDYNESSVSVNLTNGGSTPYIAFSQESASSSWTNYACNYNASSMITLSTNGRDMQLSNGPALDSMYASSFNPSSSPYPLQTSSAITGAIADKSGGANDVLSLPVQMMYGRGGTISDDSLNFYYSFGDLLADGRSIGFVPASDSLNYDSLGNLNRSLITEPFQVGSNSNIVFSEYSGFADSTAAKAVLGNNGYIDCTAEVIDNSTGGQIGTIKETRFTASNAGGYRLTSYLLSPERISGRTVKVKITVSTNLKKPEFALVNSVSRMDSSMTDNLQSLSLTPVTVIKNFTLTQP